MNNPLVILGIAGSLRKQSFNRSLLRAAQFVETVEDRQGLQIGSPEEVAWRKGYIDNEGLARLIEPIRESEYGKYLQRLLAMG